MRCWPAVAPAPAAAVELCFSWTPPHRGQELVEDGMREGPNGLTIQSQCYTRQANY
jgi:hypothetical protein